MKLKPNRKWGLMLLSVLLAFFVWLGVVNVADPVMTDTVEVPVEIINDEVLAANGLTYEVVGKKTATISYEVKTTDAYRIRSSDFLAYADMTELWSVTGAIPIKVEVLNHSEYFQSTPVSRTSTIRIETEPIQRKQFVVGYKITGTMEEDYVPGGVTVDPKQIYLEGPESLIGQISSVGIEIPVDGASQDFSGTAAVKIYDANGKEIAMSERITCEYPEVEYEMTVLRVKTLALDFQVSGQVADGYEFTGVECDVKSIPVEGLKSVLASFSTIVIPEDVLTLDGSSVDVIKVIDITEYLPDGVYLSEGTDKMISVVLTVEPLVTRDYTVPVVSSTFTGRDEDLIYSWEPDEIMVTVQALEEELDSLTIAADSAHFDVEGMMPGEYIVSVPIELDPAYVIINTTPVTLTISEGINEEETVESEPDDEDDEDDDEETGAEDEAGNEGRSHTGDDEAEETDEPENMTEDDSKSEPDDSDAEEERTEITERDRTSDPDQEADISEETKEPEPDEV